MIGAPPGTPDPLHAPPIHSHVSPKHHQTSQNLNYYESLYSDTLVQLEDATFTLATSQYKLMFPHEFEEILNRISEQVTASVSEITSGMLERIFQMRMGKPTKQAIREEVIKEIGEEIQRFQKKFEEGRTLITNMRKNYLKEITYLKQVGDQNKLLTQPTQQ